MKASLDHTTSLLAHTPATLNALLRDLPDEWTHANEGQNTWTAFDVVGHLISGERTDWIPRARIILQYGESRTFDPFDMQGHLREIEGTSLPQLLDEFARVRSENLFELRAWKLQPSDLEKFGTHPSLGRVTLSQLLATWADHDLTHLHQVSRILAYQYREAVGPWSQYLGVLQCNGHSAAG
jgi:DinB superfamily